MRWVQLCGSLNILWHCLFWDWNEIWPFPVSCNHSWVFQICWHIECSTFTALSFRIWNSSAGIPSPHLALWCFLRSAWLHSSHIVHVFQILKDDAVKVLHSICQQIWKTQLWPQDWKRLVFFPVPKKGNARECLNYRTVALISRASKVMLKFLQARPQQHVKWELPKVQAGFQGGRGTRGQIANICWDCGENKGVPEKYLLLLHWLC